MTYKFKTGVMALMKNESKNIEEWLDHYFWLGIDQIYLIDNASTDNTIDLARGHTRANDIQIISLPKQHNQRRHYAKAIRKCKIKRDCEWLMISDLDEFWFVKDGRKISEVLPDYDGVDVVYVNWAVFGSSGFKNHPISLRKELTLRQPYLHAHSTTKWLCRTKILSPFVTVGVHKVNGGSSSRTISDNVNLQINHYIIQSEQYFREVKMTRGDATKKSKDTIRDWDMFRSIDASCTESEHILSDLIEKRPD
ncbi:MAG: glycosyltransferase family 2 protein [Hyphomicrobiales bacterium]|uniref:glycosyltransferase family 2 protein n=1 Tax=Tateyamaria sp. TaxID=1929288 RepID=UPI00329BD566